MLMKVFSAVMVAAAFLMLGKAASGGIGLLEAVALTTSTAAVTLLILAVLIERLYNEDDEQ